MSASAEPQFRSLGLPEKHVGRAWTAATIQAGLTLILGLLAAFGVFSAPGFDAWIIVDAAILGGLAYGVWRRSRVCALLLLLYSVANEIYAAFDESAHFSIWRLIFIYFYFRGTIQLFREHRSHAATQRAET
jgi:hypothetical protein